MEYEKIKTSNIYTKKVDNEIKLLGKLENITQFSNDTFSRFIHLFTYLNKNCHSYYHFIW